MSDDFEKAVLFAFDQTGGISPELRAQAQSMLQSAVASPDAWRLCLSHLETSAYAEVRFWCLQTLHSLVQSPSYTSLDPTSRAQIKRSLVTLGTQPSSGFPSFLRNKNAQTIVAIAAQEYPEEWPTFFQDLLSTLSSGPEAVDLFCRILVSVDDDIISLEVPRSATEAKQSMHFKDSMRERALSDIATTWAQLVSAYKDTSPELAAAVLEAVQRYVHWIDISLVANDTFVPLLFNVLNTGSEEPRAAAAGVLTEIIGKRMDSLAKLSLIQNLGVVPVCSQWAGGLPGGTEEPELATKYAKLLAALATEVLEAMKKVENSVLSMAAVGLDVGEEAVGDARTACAAAAQLLNSLFPPVLTALRMGDSEIASAVVPFLLGYITRVRMLQKRSGGVVPPEAVGQLPAILEATAACARFSDDSVVYPVAPETTGEKVVAEEEEAALSDRRQDLFVLFRNAAQLSPSEAYVMVGRRLEAALTSAKSSWQDVELALSLLFHLGESASEESVKPGSGPLAALVAGVLRSEIPAAHHRLVALALLEICARYVKVVAQQAGTLMQPAVALFLGPKGLGHPSAAVQPRAAFLFCRFVKALRQQLQPVAGELLQSLQPHLAAIAGSPLTSTEQGPGKAAGASSTRGTLGTGISAADDRLYAFEAAGLLIGVESLPPETQREWLSVAILQPLVAQLETNSGPEAPLTAPQLLQQALDALTRASKGFSIRLCDSRPELGALLTEPVAPALRAVQRFHTHKLLRSKFMAYVHRLIECMGPAMVPHLSAVLWTLHQAGGDAADACDALNLLSQVVTKHKTEQLTAFVSASLPDCVAKVHHFVGEDWDWSGLMAQPAMASSPGTARLSGPAPIGSTEDLRERAELQKTYYSFLSNLVAADLSSTLLTGSREMLGTAMNDLVQGAATHVDPSVRKLCISAIGKLALDWLGDPTTTTGGALPGSGATAAGGGATAGAISAAAVGARASAANMGGSSGANGVGAQQQQGSTTLPMGVASGIMQSSPPIGMPLSSRGPRVPTMAGLDDFFIKQFGCEVLLEALASPTSTVDVRDAAAIQLLTEVAVQLQTVYRLGGDRFLSHLYGVTLPRLGWPPAAQEQLVGHITQSQPKALKDFLKQAFIELRQPTTGAQNVGGGTLGGNASLLGTLRR